jgi:hypothetical protein
LWHRTPQGWLREFFYMKRRCCEEATGGRVKIEELLVSIECLIATQQHTYGKPISYVRTTTTTK